MVSPTVARIILTVLTFSGIGWTVFARLHPSWGEPWTTSWMLRFLQKGSETVAGCDQVATLMVLLAYALLISALPETPHWFIVVIVVSLYCLGHACWSF